MAGPHDKIIADAAKSALSPLGFVRKGRSRTWLADHDWWLTVVEFQPSSWSKGSYLNVAAHWLWSAQDNLSFDFGGRVAEHEQFRSELQFASVTTGLAEVARDEALRLAQMFVSFESAADILVSEERQDRSYGQRGWVAYHAGIAAGLVGRIEDADDMFGRIRDGFSSSGSALAKEAQRMATATKHPKRFKKNVETLIKQHRAVLKLPPLSEPVF